MGIESVNPLAKEKVIKYEVFSTNSTIPYLRIRMVKEELTNSLNFKNKVSLVIILRKSTLKIKTYLRLSTSVGVTLRTTLQPP